MIIEATTAAARPRPPRARIVVADGSAPDRKLLATTLRCDGYRVSERASAAELITSLTGQPVDLILLDAELPGLSPATISALANLPVVLMTSATSERLDGWTKELDLLQRVHRPIFVDELRAAVRNALAPAPMTRDAA